MDEGNYDSEPASGYSIDNIAPEMVTGLNADVADGIVSFLGIILRQMIFHIT